jgi:hypothetical protein
MLTLEENKLYPSDLPWIHLQPFDYKCAPASYHVTLALKYLFPERKKNLIINPFC